MPVYRAYNNGFAQGIDSNHRITNDRAAYLQTVAAYRLTLEGQTFLQSITLTFTYTDQDLLGTAVDFLGAAFQTPDGYWQWIGDPAVDTAAKGRWFRPPVPPAPIDTAP